MNIPLGKEKEMAKASRKISHIQEQMENNTIFETWTQTWGIKVYPAYGIDKLKFAFIEKGAEGGGKSFDIYMECLKDGAQCFDNWAYDILHGRLEKTLAAEKQKGEQYPKAYKYVTGENAEKSIGLCNSSNGGICINACVPGDDGKKVFANIPVSFHDVRHIAERYMVTYAPRLAELEEIRKKAAVELAKWNKDEEEKQQQIDSPQPDDSDKKSGDKAKNIIPIEDVQAKVQEKSEPEYHHGNFKAREIRSLDKTGGYEVTVDDVSEKDSKKLYFYPQIPKGYEKKAVAAAPDKDNLETMDRFIKAAFSEAGKNGTKLKKAIPFKVMYATVGSNNFFVKFS